jgi:hypothetical protein
MPLKLIRITSKPSTTYVVLAKASAKQIVLGTIEIYKR